MNTTGNVPQLIADVCRGLPGAVADYLRELQPHMERMLRRALSGRGRSPLDAKLRQAAAATPGDFLQVVHSLCQGSAARLQPESATPSSLQATHLVDWNADTVVA